MSAFRYNNSRVCFFRLYNQIILLNFTHVHFLIYCSYGNKNYENILELLQQDYDRNKVVKSCITTSMAIGCETNLFSGSFLRHSPIIFLKILLYALYWSLSSAPVSRLGGSFCSVSINTFKEIFNISSRYMYEKTVQMLVFLVMGI